jgi:hypothetical protein
MAHPKSHNEIGAHEKSNVLVDQQKDPNASGTTAISQQRQKPVQKTELGHDLQHIAGTV